MMLLPLFLQLPLLLGTKDEKLLLFMAEVDNAKDEQGEGCRCQSQEWAVLGGPGPGPRPRPRWGFREWNEAQGSLGSIISPLQNNSKNKLQQSFSRRRSRASEACVSQTTGELGKRSDGETEQTESRRTGAEEKALSHYVQLLSQLWPRRGPAHKYVEGKGGAIVSCQIECGYRILLTLRPWPDH